QPELFRVLRSVLDERGSNGQVLVLGSASPEMLKQSSETLAGRIGYLELTPFLLPEVAAKGRADPTLRMHWLRGGFPRSYLAASDAASREWREEFIRTFLERDLPQLGVTIPAATLHRFWQMCAHFHGELWNASKIAQSLGVTHPTAQSYLRLLERAFILRVLPPLEANLKKRLVKTPKVYLRDSGLLHALLRMETGDELLGHPVYGSSWEGYVIEQVLGVLGGAWEAFFYRTGAGAECDLVLQKGKRRLAIECKASTAPELTAGFWNSLQDLKPEAAWVIAPVKESYPIAKIVRVSPLRELLEEIISGG
ncbi:MAG: ATP-binding protein, partial [Verrucomicrobia bacterium]|nr:ATP-binding protein [Verrucomicrobiota bacterium]